MTVPNIGGAWLSEQGKLVYIITQVHDRFAWRVVHNSGVTETGIGIFKNTSVQGMATAVDASWNFHDGHLNSGIRSSSGVVICDGDNRAIRIEWQDLDHFLRVRTGINP